MKRILIYTLLSLTIFSGCKKDNDNLIDGKKPEERVTESLSQYGERLTGSPYGWKAYLYTDEGVGGGYSFYLNFNKENRVTMLADLGYDESQISEESSYRLKANQVPSLLFDTYNYMHILADPDPDIYGGVSGFGLYSDFEFSFDEVVGDTVKLTGKLLKSQLVLVKATKAEQDSYNAKGLYNTLAGVVDYVTSFPYYYIILGDDNKLQTNFDINTKVFTLTWNDNGVVTTTSIPFSFTLTGILLKDPVIYKGKSITDFTYDPETGGLYTTVGGVKVVVSTTATPILPLHTLIGINYNAIIVPYATNAPGWSADFVTRRAAAAAASLASSFRLRLEDMTFAFNTGAKTMTLTAGVYQNANRFLAVWPYTYTKTGAGVYKFTLGTPNGNAGAIATQMAPLTTQRLNVDNFTLDYYINPANGQVLGQFKSVEHPDFFFSGTLQ
ncbi:MAG: DUF4302 domain-containing protein [Pedobacter sp.]|nr:DUF4302 domain-containing protein [Pedobacter sp.]